MPWRPFLNIIRYDQMCLLNIRYRYAFFNYVSYLSIFIFSASEKCPANHMQRQDSSRGKTILIPVFYSVLMTKDVVKIPLGTPFRFRFFYLWNVFVCVWWTMYLLSIFFLSMLLLNSLYLSPIHHHIHKILFLSNCKKFPWVVLFIPF